MAYGVLYEFHRTSTNGADMLITISQKGYSGAVKKRALGRAPVIKRDNNGHIYGTSCELYAECLVDGEFSHLYTSDAYEYKVEVYKNNTLLWAGFVSPELYSEPDIAPPYDVQIIATDGLGELKNYNYEKKGAVSILDHLNDLISHTGIALDFNIVSSLCYIKGDGEVSLEKDVLNLMINLDHEEGNTCYDVLQNILSSLNANITQHNGKYLIFRETDFINKTTNQGVEAFNVEGNRLILPVVSFGTAKTNQWWPVGQLSTTILPAKKHIVLTSPNHYKENVLNFSAWTGSDSSFNEEETAYILSGINSSITQTIDFSDEVGYRLSLRIRARNVGSGGDEEQNIGIKIEIDGRSYAAGNNFWLVKSNFSSGRPKSDYLWRSTEGQIEENIPIPTAADTSSDASNIDIVLPLYRNSNRSYVYAKKVKLTIFNPKGLYDIYVYDVTLVKYEQIKGYAADVTINNMARETESDINLNITPGDLVPDAGIVFLTGIPYCCADSEIITHWKINQNTPQDYLAAMAFDYSRSISLPRMKYAGILNVPGSVAMLPTLFLRDGTYYFPKTYNYDLYSDEITVELISISAANVSLSSVVISQLSESSANTGNTTGGGGSSGGGGGGGSVSGDYLPIAGGEITGSLNVKNTLSVGVNGHSIFEQDDSMLIQPQGNLMVIATGYEIDFIGDALNFNGSPVITTEGGAITGNLSVAGTMTIGGYEAIHKGNALSLLQTYTYTKSQINDMFANVGGGGGGGGSVSGDYLPIAGGEITGSLNVKNTLSVGVNGHSIFEQDDSMLIQPQGNLMVIATGYEIDFIGDALNFNGSPVITTEGGAITGNLSVAGTMTIGGYEAIHKGNALSLLQTYTYTKSQINDMFANVGGGGAVSGNYLPISGGTLTGPLTAPSNSRIGGIQFSKTREGYYPSLDFLITDYIILHNSGSAYIAQEGSYSGISFFGDYNLDGNTPFWYGLKGYVEQSKKTTEINGDNVLITSTNQINAVLNGNNVFQVVDAGTPVMSMGIFDASHWTAGEVLQVNGHMSVVGVTRLYDNLISTQGMTLEGGISADFLHLKDGSAIGGYLPLSNDISFRDNGVRIQARINSENKVEFYLNKQWQLASDSILSKIANGGFSVQLNDNRNKTYNETIQTLTSFTTPCTTASKLIVDGSLILGFPFMAWQYGGKTYYTKTGGEIYDFPVIANTTFPITGGKLDGPIELSALSTFPYNGNSYAGILSFNYNLQDKTAYNQSYAAFAMLCADTRFLMYCRKINGETSNIFWLSQAGNMGISGTLTQSSDARLKNIEQEFSLGLKDIADAPLVKFSWVDNRDEHLSHVGTIAQYWLSHLPEVVESNDEQLLGLDYSTLGVAMGISIAREIVDMKKEIQTLKEKIYES